MSEYFFNMDDGYFEGLVRGFRSGILRRADYMNLAQCETLDGAALFFFFLSFPRFSFHFFLFFCVRVVLGSALPVVWSEREISI